MKKEYILSKDRLQKLIDNPITREEAIGRALVRLFDRQIKLEKEKNTTFASNKKGFTQPDAKAGSIHAKYFIRNGTLMQFQVWYWAKIEKSGFSRLSKYWKQLNEVAEIKMGIRT